MTLYYRFRRMLRVKCFYIEVNINGIKKFCAIVNNGCKVLIVIECCHKLRKWKNLAAYNACLLMCSTLPVR